MTELMHLLPGPKVAVTGDLVYVATIYPVKESGFPVRSDAPTSFVGDSDMYVQSRCVLQELGRRLEEAGSSLSRVLRVEVQLQAAADFYEFKRAWIEAFGDDPPARTTIVTGDDWIAPGVGLGLNAVALSGDSSLQREVIHTDEAPNPMPWEHAPQAIKAGPWVFPSALPACDFETGIPVGKRLPAFPYYANDATAQAEYVFSNLQKVMHAAGTDVGNTVKAHLYEPSLLTFPDVDAVWAEYMQRPPTRASMAVRDLLVPRAVFVANLTVLAPPADDSMEIVETRKGISWHPVDVRKVNFTPGIAVGSDWLFLAGQVPVPDFATGVVDTGPRALLNYFSDIEWQTEATMRLLNSQIEANGFDIKHVVDAHVFLVHAQRDYRGFARAWERILSDAGVENPPPITLIPSRQRNGETGIMFLGPDPVIRPDIEIDLVLHRG